MATDPAPKMTAEMLRFGYNSERRQALDGLRRELDNAARALVAARRAAADGWADGPELRNLATAACEAGERGGALAALGRVDFLLPDTNSKPATSE